MSETALEVVMNRNFFYRDNYRRVVAFALLLILSNIAALGVIFWLISHPTKPAYFATDNSGKVTPLYSLSQPIISQSSLLEWATRASVAAYSYNFVEYESQLQKAGNFFTLDRSENYVENNFDDKLLGIYFIVEVKHIFNEDNTYNNQIFAVKTYNFKDLKFKENIL